jgi:hypothetical protein
MPRNLETRRDTYPYVSCDSYAMRCEIAFPRKISEKEFIESLSIIGEPQSIYIPSRFTAQAVKYFAQEKMSFRKIVIGDDDETLDKNQEAEISRISQKVYGINVVEGNSSIIPLPIGLESPSYRSGGRMSDFRRRPKTDSVERELSFLVAWNQSTNLLKREIAFRSFELVPKTFLVRKRIPAQVIHNLMRKTLFIPCPAGNGLDTHRVWEAIYLGSIPVVLREDAFSALTGWPVLLVDSWHEVTSFSRKKLEELYNEIIWEPERVLEKSKEILSEIQS